MNDSTNLLKWFYLLFWHFFRWDAIDYSWSLSWLLSLFPLPLFPTFLFGRLWKRKINYHWKEYGNKNVCIKFLLSRILTKLLKDSFKEQINNTYFRYFRCRFLMTSISRHGMTVLVAVEWPRRRHCLCRRRLTQSTTEFVSQTLRWVRLRRRGWSGRVWRNLSSTPLKVVTSQPVRFLMLWGRLLNRRGPL